MEMFVVLLYLIMMIFVSLISLTISVLCIIGTWKVFKKAGKGGWEAIVPGYNGWVLFEISGLNWWWFLIFMSPVIASFIPLINGISGLACLFAIFNCNYNIAKKFNKGTGFAVCLTLFPYVCYPMLGLSKKLTYNHSIMVSNNGVFDASKPNNSNNQQQYNNNQGNNNNFDNSNGTVTHDYSFCGNCGTRLEHGVQFCPNCGQKNM